MCSESKGCGERRSFAHVLLIPALALTTILLSIQPLHARQVIDPRSGRLFLAATDLSLQAGAVQLEFLRVLVLGRPANRGSAGHGGLTLRV